MSSKNYLSGMVDLTGDSYLNPVGAQYGDGTGTHQRAEGQIKSISIHHDAMIREHDYDSIARYKQEAAGHYARLGPGLQYHYKIDNTGVIFKIRPHTTWLYVVGSEENTSTLAICLDGYFHPPYNQTPTREQYEALGQLLVMLCEQSPQFPATYPDVRPHRDYSATACPGDLFAPWVYAIQSKADVLNTPQNAVYDWPQYQDLPPAVPQLPVESPHGPAAEPTVPEATPVIVEQPPPAPALPSPVTPPQPLPGASPTTQTPSPLPTAPSQPPIKAPVANSLAGLEAFWQEIVTFVKTLFKR